MRALFWKRQEARRVALGRTHEAECAHICSLVDEYVLENYMNKIYSCYLLSSLSWPPSCTILARI